jgi:regulator of sigma E protease
VPDQDDLEELREEIIAEEGSAALKDYFHFKPVWQRAFVTVAGPLMNFLLSITIYSALLLGFGSTQVDPHVGTVEAGSPAEAAGFKAGDTITAADGKAIEDFRDLQLYVVLRAGDPIVFDVERGAERLQLTATPRRTKIKDPTGAEATIGRLGMAPNPADYHEIRYNPITAIGAGTQETFKVLGLSLRYIGRVITGRESGDQLGGPVGIARTAGAVSQQAAAIEGSFWLKSANVALQLVQMVAMISVGIGFLNLLPIPVLDGGHLLFYGYEAVARRPLDAKIQAAGFQVGLALLLGLMLFVTWNDLKKLPLFQHMGGLFS